MQSFFSFICFFFVSTFRIFLFVYKHIRSLKIKKKNENKTLTLKRDIEPQINDTISEPHQIWNQESLTTDYYSAGFSITKKKKINKIKMNMYVFLKKNFFRELLPS